MLRCCRSLARTWLKAKRNTRFNAAGNALTAGLMGLTGQYFAKSAIFFGAAV